MHGKEKRHAIQEWSSPGREKQIHEYDMVSVSDFFALQNIKQFSNMGRRRAFSNFMKRQEEDILRKDQSEA